MIERKYSDALLNFEAASLLGSTLESKEALRDDIAYFKAVASGAIYRANPSAKTGVRALRSWQNVSDAYHSTPKHPRYIEASVNATSLAAKYSSSSQ